MAYSSNLKLQEPKTVIHLHTKLQYCNVLLYLSSVLSQLTQQYQLHLNISISTMHTQQFPCKLYSQANYVYNVHTYSCMTHKLVHEMLCSATC